MSKTTKHILHAINSGIDFDQKWFSEDEIKELFARLLKEMNWHDEFIRCLEEKDLEQIKSDFLGNGDEKHD